MTTTTGKAPESPLSRFFFSIRYEATSLLEQPTAAGPAAAILSALQQAEQVPAAHPIDAELVDSLKERIRRGLDPQGECTCGSNPEAACAPCGQAIAGQNALEKLVALVNARELPPHPADPKGEDTGRKALRKVLRLAVRHGQGLYLETDTRGFHLTPGQVSEALRVVNLGCDKVMHHAEASSARGWGGKSLPEGYRIVHVPGFHFVADAANAIGHLFSRVESAVEDACGHAAAGPARALPDEAFLDDERVHALLEYAPSEPWEMRALAQELLSQRAGREVLTALGMPSSPGFQVLRDDAVRQLAAGLKPEHSLVADSVIISGLAREVMGGRVAMDRLRAKLHGEDKEQVEKAARILYLALVAGMRGINPWGPHSWPEWKDVSPRFRAALEIQALLLVLSAREVVFQRTRAEEVHEQLLRRLAQPFGADGGSAIFTCRTGETLPSGVQEHVAQVVLGGFDLEAKASTAGEAVAMVLAQLAKAAVDLLAWTAVTLEIPSPEDSPSKDYADALREYVNAHAATKSRVAMLEVQLGQGGKEWMALQKALGFPDDGMERSVLDARDAAVGLEQRLAEALADNARLLQRLLKSCPLCHGKGTWSRSCSLCGDSTYDHECNDRDEPCDHEVHALVAQPHPGASLLRLHTALAPLFATIARVRKKGQQAGNVPISQVEVRAFLMHQGSAGGITFEGEQLAALLESMAEVA